MSASFTTIHFKKEPLPGFISILIPVENDAVGLRQTLLSLSKQTVPRSHFEILVGNDGGFPAVDSVCRDFDVSVISVHTASGSYAMRNKLMEQSRGEVFAFIDAQTQASPSWLEDGLRLTASFEYVGGAIAVIPDPSKHVSQLLLIYQRVMTFDVLEYMATFHFASTTNLFVSRAMIVKMGGFDRRLKSSGDLEFGQRALDIFHAKYAYGPHLLVHHLTRTFWALTIKQRRIAHGHFSLSQYYPERFKQFQLSLPALLLRLFVPPVWVFFRKRMATLSRLSRLCVFFVHCWMNVSYVLFRIEALMFKRSERFR